MNLTAKLSFDFLALYNIAPGFSPVLKALNLKYRWVLSKQLVNNGVLVSDSHLHIQQTWFRIHILVLKCRLLIQLYLFLWIGKKNVTVLENKFSLTLNFICKILYIVHNIMYVLGN